MSRSPIVSHLIVHIGVEPPHPPRQVGFLLFTLPSRPTDFFNASGTWFMASPHHRDRTDHLPRPAESPTARTEFFGMHPSGFRA